MEDESFFNIVARGKYLIALTTILAVAAAVFLTSRAERVYEGTAILQVNSSTNPTRAADPFNAQQASQGLAATYETLIGSRGFLTRIAPEIGIPPVTPTELMDRVEAKAILGTALIEVKVHDHSPEAARNLAGAIANAFVRTTQQGLSQRSIEQQRLLQARISAISGEIAKLRSGTGDLSTTERLESLRRARAALSAQYASIVANGIQEGGIVSVAAPSTASSTPISPRPVLNAVAALLLGLLVGLVLAWFRARLDQGVRSAEEAEQLLDAPLLASVPIRKRSSRRARVLEEAYDVLHAKLAFQSVEQGLRVVTFSSYGHGDGKTTSVEGLADAAARAGMSVLVIDGDLRTQGLSRRLGHEGAVGLADVILDQIDLTEALIEVRPGLTLLPAGPMPANIPSLLGKERMRYLVAQLRDRHDLVIIDAPPVANLADASILASVSDGVVLVARIGVTKRAHLRAVAADLRHTQIPIVGLVALDPRVIGSPYALLAQPS